MQGKVEICGVNTSRLPTLDAERTRELLLRTGKGDKTAREELIAGNLRLVLSVIQRFAARGENIDDLFQVGCIGLIKAIDKYNHTRRWRILLEKLNLPIYNNRGTPNNVPQLKVRVISDYNFEGENPSD